MASLSDVEKLLPSLSPGEKAQILKWVVQELGDVFPGIDSRPDVCGGEPCIVRTRIPVWLLEQARRLGSSEQALLAAYPSLRAEDLVKHGPMLVPMPLRSRCRSGRTRLRSSQAPTRAALVDGAGVLEGAGSTRTT